MSERRVLIFDAGPAADERLSRMLAEDPSLADCLEQRTLDGVVSCYREPGAAGRNFEKGEAMCTVVQRAVDEGRLDPARASEFERHYERSPGLVREILAELPPGTYRSYSDDDVTAARLRIPKEELI